MGVQHYWVLTLLDNEKKYLLMITLVELKGSDLGWRLSKQVPTGKECQNVWKVFAASKLDKSISGIIDRLQKFVSIIIKKSKQPKSVIEDKLQPIYEVNCAALIKKSIEILNCI